MQHWATPFSHLQDWSYSHIWLYLRLMDIPYCVLYDKGWVNVGCYTIDVKKFAGLNFHGFNPTKVFVEILWCFLSQNCLLLKSGAYIHWKTFAVLLLTMKVNPANLFPFYCRFCWCLRVVVFCISHKYPYIFNYSVN